MMTWALEEGYLDIRLLKISYLEKTLGVLELLDYNNTKIRDYLVLITRK